jgi:hypothetical protein
MYLLNVRIVITASKQIRSTKPNEAVKEATDFFLALHVNVVYLCCGAHSKFISVKIKITGAGCFQKMLRLTTTLLGQFHVILERNKNFLNQIL